MNRIWTLPFVLAFAGHFVVGLAIHGFVHLPAQLREWGGNEIVIGAVVATLSFSAIASRPIIGRWMDERGRRRVLLVGGVIHVVACALYLTVEGIGPWLFVVRAIHGIAEAALFSVFFTIAADLVPEARRTEGIALFGVSGMLPISLGPLLGDAVLRFSEFRTLFAVLTVLAVLALLASLPIGETRPVVHGRLPGGVMRALRNPRLGPLWMVGIVFAFALTSYFVFLKNFVVDRSLGEVSTFFTPYAVVAVLLRLGLGWVPDRFGPRRTLFPAMLVLAFGIGCIAFAYQPWHVAAAGALCGLGHGYVFPIISALIVDRADPGDRGAAITIFTALFDVGLLAGGPVLGAVADATGPRPMFVTAAAAAVVGLVVFALWDRPERPAQSLV